MREQRKIKWDYSSVLCSVHKINRVASGKPTDDGRICTQGVTKRCRLSLLTNSALVYEPKCGEGGELRGPSQWVQLCTWNPNKLCVSNSIFNLCMHPQITQPSVHYSTASVGWSVRVKKNGIATTQKFACSWLLKTTATQEGDVTQ